MNIKFMNNNPSYICIPCGSQFLTNKQKKHPKMTTMHKAKCDLCGNETGVTHVRHFNWAKKPNQ